MPTERYHSVEFIAHLFTGHTKTQKIKVPTIHGENEGNVIFVSIQPW